jgi:hypothetical protein
MADTAPALVKLEIRTYPDQKFSGSGDESWFVLFNPSEYVRTRTNAYSKTKPPGRSKPTTAFSSGDSDKLSLTLFFDGTGAAGKAQPVTPDVKKFLDLMRYKGDRHKPHYLRLLWGGASGGLDFCCALVNATATYTLFNRKGEPIRAKVAASFEEVMSEAERAAMEGNASPDLHRVWRVQDGESIDLIAFQSYGNVRYWRAIAQANRLENPRSLPAGLLLALPPTEG